MGQIANQMLLELFSRLGRKIQDKREERFLVKRDGRRPGKMAGDNPAKPTEGDSEKQGNIL